MAGGKKKKKPASNPARGFATTSVASKPKFEADDTESEPSTTNNISIAVQAHLGNSTTVPASNNEVDSTVENLTAEEFEKQLENSELQVLVERHAQKSKRDALRQKSRLETERRVLRGQAENLNSRKWLPPELMEEILDMIKEEGHFPGHAAEKIGGVKQASEEDLTVRLWTLQQALVGSGFLEYKVLLALRYVLGISDKIGTGNKDAIWGMEESLDWLARECSRDELPDYENGFRKQGLHQKSQAGRCSRHKTIRNMLTYRPRYSKRQSYGVWYEHSMPRA